MKNKKELKKFDVYCTYCGFNQVYTFKPDNDFKTMDDIVNYNYEYTCNRCGCGVRVGDALDYRDLQELGYE